MKKPCDVELVYVIAGAFLVPVVLVLSLVMAELGAMPKIVELPALIGLMVWAAVMVERLRHEHKGPDKNEP